MLKVCINQLDFLLFVEEKLKEAIEVEMPESVLQFFTESIVDSGVWERVDIMDIVKDFATFAEWEPVHDLQAEGETLEETIERLESEGCDVAGERYVVRMPI